MQTLPIHSYIEIHPGSARRFLHIKIGQKTIAILGWMEPVLPGGDPRWWLTLSDGKMVAAGFNEEEAIQFVLRGDGYIE